MEENNLKRIKSHYQLILDTLDVEPVCETLFSRDVLSAEEFEHISVSQAKYEKTRKLVRFLLKKTDKAYECFLHACIETGQPHIVNKLKSTDLTLFDETTFTSSLNVDETLILLQEQLLVQFRTFKEVLQPTERPSKERPYQKVVTLLERSGVHEEKAVTMLSTYLEQKSQNPTSNLCEALARDLGRDIVVYMVDKQRGCEVKQASTRYAATMRRMVDVMIVQYQEEFRQFFRQLNVNEMNGYQTFIKVADVIFGQGQNNWGRVVALYAFMGWVAQICAREPQMLEMLGDFLGFYVAQKLGPWIQAHGGWDAFDEQYREENKSSWNMVKVLGLLTVGALVGAVAVRHT